MTPETVERIGAAVQAVHAAGEYPSAARTARQMGRPAGGLTGAENRHRAECMRKLGIPLKRVGFGDLDASRHDWWNL